MREVVPSISCRSGDRRTAGYDGVVVPERHTRTETMRPKPLLALMAMAMNRNRSTGHVCPSTRLLHPSPPRRDDRPRRPGLRGRLILGIGSGYTRIFQHLGEPFNQRLGRFLWRLRVLNRAWTGDRFDWNGRYWQMKNVR